MHTIRGKFANRGSSKTSSRIQTKVEFVGHIPNCSQTSCYACKVLTKFVETKFAVLYKRRCVEMAVIYTGSSREMPLVYFPFSCCKVADIEEMMVGNQVFFALIDVLLIHTSNACRELPIMGKSVKILKVVVDGMQSHGKSGFWFARNRRWTFLFFLFELASIVLLIAHNRLECAVPEVPCIVAHNLCMKHFLVAWTLYEIAVVVSLTLSNAWSKVDVREAKP